MILIIVVLIGTVLILKAAYDNYKQYLSDNLKRGW